MDFVITDRAALERLRHDRSLRRMIRRIRVQAATQACDVRKLELRINRDYFACGCETGAVSVLLLLASVGSVWLLAPTLVAWTWWKVALAVALAALTGKCVGLLLARYRLRRSLHVLDLSL